MRLQPVLVTLLFARGGRHGRFEVAGFTSPSFLRASIFYIRRFSRNDDSIDTSGDDDFLSLSGIASFGDTDAFSSTEENSNWVCSCGWINRYRNLVCGGYLLRGVSEANRSYGCGAPRPPTANISSDSSGSHPVLRGHADDSDVKRTHGRELPSTGGSQGAAWTWLIRHGQPVEVWHEKKTVFGNAIIKDNGRRYDTIVKRNKTVRQPTTHDGGKLRVLVFDPSVNMVVSKRCDDRDSEKDATAHCEHAARNIIEVAVDQVVGTWVLPRSTANSDRIDATCNHEAYGDFSFLYPQHAIEWSQVLRDSAALHEKLPRERDSKGMWRAANAVGSLKTIPKKNNENVEEGAGQRNSITTRDAARFLLFGAFYEPSSDERWCQGVLSDGLSSLHPRVVAAAHALASQMLSAAKSTYFSRSVPSFAGLCADTGVRRQWAFCGEGGGQGSADGPRYQPISSVRNNGNSNDSNAVLETTTETHTHTNAFLLSSFPDALELTGGGWRPLAQSVVRSKEVMSFVEAVKSGRRSCQTNGNSKSGQSGDKEGVSIWSVDGQHHRIVEQLEFIAMGGGAALLGNEGKQAMRALGVKGVPTKQICTDLLIDSGYWSRKRASSETIPVMLGKGRFDAVAASSVNHWPDIVWVRAVATANCIAERRQRLARIPPPPIFHSFGECAKRPRDSSCHFRPVDTACVVPGSSDNADFAAATAVLDKVAVEARMRRQKSKRWKKEQEAVVAKAADTVFTVWPTASWCVRPLGRVDLRGTRETGSTQTLTPLCIDNTRSGLKDDAVCWDPETHTLLVHSTSHLVRALYEDRKEPLPPPRAAALVAKIPTGLKPAVSKEETPALTSRSRERSRAEIRDNQGNCPRGCEKGDLDAIAERRGEACYLPGGALLLLPAPLLNAASLASGFEVTAARQAQQRPSGLATANECITVAFRFNPEDGSLMGSWLFESVIGPVTTITFNVADANIFLPSASSSSLSSIAASATSSSSAPSVTSLLNPTTNTALVALHEALPWMEKARARHRKNTASRTKKKTCKSVEAMFSSERIVDAALSLFSEEAFTMIRRRRVVPPRVGRATRFGTAPLRRYADLLAQRQLLSLV